MEVEITLDGEVFKFHLGNELKIVENKINNMVKTQPAGYGFISMLHKRMLAKLRELERRKKSTHSKLFLHHSSSRTTKFYKANNKYPNKDLAAASAEQDKKYQRIIREITRIESNISILEVCVRSMELKSNLLQTLSSNVRKERN